jgi:hypothetical protein
MTGTYPAVLGLNAQHRCGAPATLAVGPDPSARTDTYGPLLHTSEGSFGIEASIGGDVTTCGNLCGTPITFFLNSSTAQVIVLDAFLDNAGTVYVDGAPVQTYRNREQKGVTIPAGAFALSVLACSSDGNSVGTAIYNSFISTYNLTVDFDRVFHRNGK